MCRSGWDVLVGEGAVGVGGVRAVSQAADARPQAMGAPISISCRGTHACRLRYAPPSASSIRLWLTAVCPSRHLASIWSRTVTLWPAHFATCVGSTPAASHVETHA